MRVRYSFSSRRTGRIDSDNKHRVAYPKLVLDVIKSSDIILEILDARFIEETRNKEFEEIIKTQGKKIIYVFNKSDLVDIREIIKNIELEDLIPYVFVSCTKRQGSKELRERIKIEVKKLKIEKAKVGIIGYPNTGKSSVINFLIGKASARTAAEAGWTKGLQKVKLAEGIFLLDTPGVIPEKEAVPGTNIQKHAEIGVRMFDKVKEPELVIDNMMKKYPGIFEKFYEIDAGGDSEVLIEELGRKLGFLKKGKEIDSDRTARKILRDWQEGKIRV